MTFAHVFDIGAACVLAFFVVRGALRGLTGEIISLLGLVASVFCGWTFAEPLGEIVLQHFPSWDRTVTQLICSVVIFMGVSLAFAAVAKILRMLVKAANLSILDHVLGAVSGAARAFFLVLFIYGAVSIFSPVIPSEWMKESVTMQGTSVVWPTVFKFLTDRGWISPDSLKPAPMATPTSAENAAQGLGLFNPALFPAATSIVSGEPGR